MKKGIDISYCQPSIDWLKVTADFAIIKAGERNFTDPYFEQHYRNAKAAGIPVGAYWYLDALSVSDAAKEADEFLKRIEGKQFEYPVYLDLENEAQFKTGKENVSAMIRSFLSKVEAAGYWVGLYGSYSSLNTFTADDIKKRYAIWLAHWVNQTNYSGSYGLWQYGVGTAAGVTGKCDLDYAYVDYPKLIKEKGLNGYCKPAEQQKKEISIEMTVDGITYKGTLYEK